MTRREIDDNIPALLEHYDAIVEHLDVRRIQNADKRKVTRRRVLDLYLATGDINGTADRCGVYRALASA